MRILILIAGLTLSLWGIFTAGRSGFSRMFSEYAMSTGIEAAAVRAEELTPEDPEAHFSRAKGLLDKGSIDDSVAEFERAVALRPKDYYLWLSLGEARDRANMDEGAIAAFEESVRLAPHYAEPHWQLGNLFFRARRKEEGFAELRLAVKSDPSLLPNFVDLAWGANRGDVESVVETLQPTTDDEHLALARFFVRHGNGAVASEQFQAARNVSTQIRKSFVNDLMANRNFEEAFTIWSRDHPIRAGFKTALNNPGFEDPSGFNEPGFGWQFSRDTGAVHVARDPDQPREGAYSLRVDWSGESNASIPVVSQLFLVDPESRYRLHFSARAQELVTGGLPYIVVTDVTSKDERVLGQSAPLREGSSPWRDYAVDFETRGTTVGIAIGLRREVCNGGRCPIFGHLWLDAFAIEKI